MIKQPIGYKSVCNTLAIVIYSLDEESVKVRYEGGGYQLETYQRIVTRKLQWDENGAYFVFHGNKEYLSEYLRIKQ
jgi:hypothetical protein